MPRKRQGRIFKIVLFGSYARGDCVNDLDGGYVSDYDLLVVVNHEKLTEVLEYWAKAEDHLTREYAIAHRLTAPVNFIVHTLTEVNKKLKKGRPFFVDVASDEIVLHEAPDSTFERPELLPPTEAFQEALGDLEYWLPMSAHAMQLAEASVANGVERDAAFMPHQSAERAYHCGLLVLTLYTPFCRTRRMADYAERRQGALVCHGVADDLLRIVSCLPRGSGMAILTDTWPAWQNMTAPH